MNVEEKNATSTIKSVDRSLEVLEAFSEIKVPSVSSAQVIQSVV
jgi:hypothetical protein